jgi:hypothetical protein
LGGRRTVRGRKVEGRRRKKGRGAGRGFPSPAYIVGAVSVP